MACIIPGGIIQITGEFDVGKTSMALECGYHPSQIIFVDNDVKGKATVKQLIDDGLEFARYIDFTAMVTNKSTWGVYQQTIAVLDEVEEIVVSNQDVKCLIWDTWSRAGGSFVEYVRKYPERFVVPNSKGNYWTGNAQIVTGTQYKYAALHESAMLNKMQKIIPLIFLVTHIKNRFDGSGVKIGVKPDSSKALNRVPYFRVWLRRNPESAIPIALVTKRINKKIYDESVGGLRTQSILPPKVTPNIILPEENGTMHNDRSLWDTIARYYEHPAGLRKLLPAEIPDEKENAILSGTMTKEQRIEWLAALQQKKLVETENTLLLATENPAKAIELSKSGKSLSEIAAQLQVPLNTVAQWISQN